MTPRVIEFDMHDFGFVRWACSVFDVDDLARLHELPDPADFDNYVERLRHRVGQLRERASDILDSCMRLKEDVLAPVFGPIVHFQFPPSLRCHLAGAGTASQFHRDGDPKYGLRPHTLNAWIPLTEVSGTNSLHIESAVGSGDYRPLELAPGELVVFDAFHLSHGSRANRTSATRVSMDIRFVPVDPSVARALGAYAG